MRGFSGRWTPIRVLWVPVALGLVGCAEEQPYRAPTFPFLSGYSAAGKGAPVLLTNTEWWRGFRDPTLDELVTRALTNNLSLAVARERVRESEAVAQAVPTGFELNTNAAGVAERSGGIDYGYGKTTSSLSYLFDPAGGRRAEIKAARARIEVADAEVSAAQLLVLYNLTNAYVDLRYSQRLLALRRQELASRRQTLDLTNSLFSANSATRLDVTRAEAGVAEMQAEIPGLEGSVVANKNRIAALIGVVPGGLKMNLEDKGNQPRTRLSPSVGIPADLLRNRPDVRIAERLYYASLADVGVARAELYPKLSLSGAITLNALEGGKTATEYYFGPVLQFPVIPDNSAKAGVNAAWSRAQQAHTTWKSTVLEAIVEVENALVDLKSSGGAVVSSEKAVSLYRESLSLTRELVSNGGATISDLIDAERDIARANTALAQNLREQARSFISLNINLGSGSSTALAPPNAALASR